MKKIVMIVSIAFTFIMMGCEGSTTSWQGVVEMVNPKTCEVLAIDTKDDGIAMKKQRVVRFREECSDLKVGGMVIKTGLVFYYFPPQLVTNAPAEK